MISLKTFHLFFISMSFIITIWFAIYIFQQPSNGLSPAVGILSLVCGMGLLIYGKNVYKKFKGLS
ncbi:MAG: hypothetical protein ACE5D0_01710 [Fidelibacterota bacterium]